MRNKGVHRVGLAAARECGRKRKEFLLSRLCVCKEGNRERKGKSRPSMGQLRCASPCPLSLISRKWILRFYRTRRGNMGTEVIILEPKGDEKNVAVRWFVSQERPMAAPKSRHSRALIGDRGCDLGASRISRLCCGASRGNSLMRASSRSLCRPVPCHTMGTTTAHDFRVVCGWCTLHSATAGQ